MTKRPKIYFARKIASLKMELGKLNTKRQKTELTYHISLCSKLKIKMDQNS